MDSLYERKDVMDSVIDIAKQIDEESNKYDSNADKMTKLMFEQMLRGLYLQNVQMN